MDGTLQPPLDAARWQRLSMLFDTARELSGPERARWLADLCRQDADLAPWLGEMLAAHASRRTDDWLERGPQLRLGAAEADDSDAARGLVPGARVGPWVLHARLGQGGMATVWRASRFDALPAREVALKLPLLRLAGDRLAQRFARERDILARLSHPNIVPLFAAGVAPDGMPWLAMELVSGQPIDRWCAERRCSLQQRLALFHAVLDAVQHAHGQLVIHRDLKPGNILVGEDGRVRLLDFGIAQLLADDSAQAEPLTQAAARPMTLAYAAPEQLLGQPLGTATDVHALGVVLFELLTGRRPFQPTLDTPAQTELAITSGDRIKASQAVTAAAATACQTTPQRLVRALRGDLDTVLAKAMHRDPAQRHATVADLADDLRRWAAGEPVRARPDSRRYRFSRFVQRHRLPVASGVVALAALLGALGLSLWQTQRAQHERDRALAARANSAAVNAFLNDLLNDAARTGQPIRVPELLSRAERMARQTFARQPDQLAMVLFSLSKGDAAWLGTARSRTLTREALALARDPELRAAIDVADAWLSAHAADASADPGAGRARLLAQLARQDLPPELRGEALTLLGELDYLDGRAADALAHQDQAVQAFRQATHLPPLTLASQLSRLAVLRVGAGQAQAGEALFDEAMGLIRASGRDRGADVQAVRNERALALFLMGQPLRAAPLVEESLRIADEDQPGTPAWLYLVRGVGLAHWATGRYDQAMAVLDRGLARVRADGTDAHDLERVMECDRGLVLARQGQVQAAAEALRNAARLRRQPLQFSAFYDTQCQLAQAEVALLAGEVAAPRQALEALLPRLAAQAPGFMGTALSLHAIALMRSGEPAAALADLDQLLAISRKTQGDAAFSSRTGRALMLMAQARQQLGQAEQATALARQADANLRPTVGEAHPWLQELAPLIHHQVASRSSPS